MASAGWELSSGEPTRTGRCRRALVRPSGVAPAGQPDRANGLLNLRLFRRGRSLTALAYVEMHAAQFTYTCFSLSTPKKGLVNACCRRMLGE